MFDTKKSATAHIISLSNPSKMPGYSWGLPAGKSCPIGQKLMLVPDSVCSSCYAQKGQYRFTNVKTAQEKRLQSTHSIFWESAMVKMIQGEKYFRWHDSGDFFSYWYLEKVMRVIKSTPKTQHWVPTHEKRLIARYIREHGKLPSNCVVRISGAMIDGKPPSLVLCTSTVHSIPGQNIGHECKAYKRGGKCGNCRICWNPKIKNVSYLLH